MAPQSYRPEGKTILAAVTTVAAVYVYFLIFAQFGFLKAVQAALGDHADDVRRLLASMGFGGIAGSVLAARHFAEERGRRWLVAGLGMGALAAAWTLVARARMEFHFIALLTGLGTGLATVTLAALLRRAAGEKHLGVIIGLGTGLAYAFCNLPGAFGAEARNQAGLALLAAVAGLAGVSALKPRVRAEPLQAADYSPVGALAWTAVFLALVALDSAVFYFIQRTPELRERHWGGERQQWLNAAVHVGAALAAGWALDRQWMGRVMLAGATALVLAAAGIGLPGAGLVYIAAVSVYSTALVHYPACSGHPGLAAWVYAVAGWGGSAAGIMTATGRAGVPAGLVLAAVMLLATGLIGRYFASRRA